MRLFLLLLANLLLSKIALAQFSKKFEVGSYVLIENRNERQYGQLKLRSEKKLRVKSPEGNAFRLKPNQVHNFRIGSRHYIVAKDFHLSENSHSIDVKAAFVERLDSGQIVLMRYDHFINTGANWLFLYRYPIAVYLLSDPSSSAFNLVYNYFNKSLFREQVRPFLTMSPDLIQMLDKGKITFYNLPSAIHALNNNSPFLPSDAPERKQ
ncbi:hypothetical protein SAMN00120144_2274 [Hymenobacter roseosalivarius DSM 11622]|uniref:Uncharacterized protein n=1 Tax=Hymenobacter roseosalivarius DSM 11622 TaxID=645990 RepID=A0A1W1VX35_9BACT|nr:hypothetical protein [Hymenobacter roseosalivarius]SMB97915.1 hypothetical protein SAMN00120144_2274 [Hymenobacter roseosalivarius DSM 11622]